jgi:mannose-6-phosphate isomerase-like protein (cupin superfamily)
MQVINKPWGKEVWIELNNRYCFKRIHLNKAKRTSFQYHEKKLETFYILEGELEVWLENEEGILEKKRMLPGDHSTIYPFKKHRMIAIADSIYLEASTPEVDDVIRIEDDSQRPHGRIESEYKK